MLATVLLAAAVALLLRLPEPARSVAPARRPWLELKDGAGLVWQHRLLQSVLLTAVARRLSWFVLQAAYAPDAMRSLFLDLSTVGLTLPTAVPAP